MNHQIFEAIDELKIECHMRSLRAGWYKDYEQLISILSTFDSDRDSLHFVEKLFITSRLCLTHSEISEAMEGSRKNLPDDHLPQYPMVHVELADALIRIFDLAGFLRIENFGRIVREKMEYNAVRKDHRLENRQKSY